MEFQSQDPLCRFTDLIATMIRRSSCDERNILSLALELFTECTSKYAYLDPETTREIEEQIEWIDLYKSHQDRYPTYRRRLGDSLLPVTEDTDNLIPRFAQEVLEGAKDIAHMLHVQLPEQWTRVGEEFGCEKEQWKPQYSLEKSEMEDSEGEDDVETAAMAYSYAYF